MAFFFGKQEAEQEQRKFDIIYNHYRNLMYHVAYNILNNHHDAEDAVAEALCKIAQNISKIDEPICPKTKSFIVIITKRQAIDSYRSKRRRGEVAFEECVSEDPENYATEDVMRHSVLALSIAKLPENYREVILLKFSQGYSTREIAGMLGYSVAKVEKLIARGKAKLAEVLKEVSAE